MDDSKLTHVDEAGRLRMVDVGDKPVTRREAVASGRVEMKPETLALITAGQIVKGNVFETARLAGIMAAKRTSDIIPLCHPLALSGIEVDIAPVGDSAIEVRAECRIDAKTGVEMEALTAVSAACLTIYDMCKAVDRGMRITDIQLDSKSGGRSGTFARDAEQYEDRPE